MSSTTSAATVAQPGILAPPPPLACYLLLQTQTSDTQTLIPILSREFAEHISDGQMIVGLGGALMSGADSAIGYRTYQQPNDGHALAPANQCDLAFWLRGSDRGELLHLSRQIVSTLHESCNLSSVIHSFTYRRRLNANSVVAHDLSGFEDGTENPTGQVAIDTALISSPAQHLNGGSLWALQVWQHNFDWLNEASSSDKERAIGRSLQDNRELIDNAPSAHVVRTEQESFSPEAHMLRRSMPWSDDHLNGGLMFSCFAHSFYPFEIQLSRMRGCEDGIEDAVFQFSKILSTGYFWCPPIDASGRLR